MTKDEAEAANDVYWGVIARSTGRLLAIADKLGLSEETKASIRNDAAKLKEYAMFRPYDKFIRK